MSADARRVALPAGFARRDGELCCDGFPVTRAEARVRAAWPDAEAFYLYSAAQIAERVRRFQAAFAPLAAHVAFALKANALPWLLARLARLGVGADVVSRGEMLLAEQAGFPLSGCVVNGNGKTRAELEWAVEKAPHSVNVDSAEELEALAARARDRAAAVRVALRVNPAIVAPGHPYVATGSAEAKFGLPPEAALAALERSAEFAPVRVDGIHLHVGSQMLDPRPLEQALDFALRFRARAQERGAAIRLINLGGGFGVDYARGRDEFPLEDYARRWAQRVAGMELEWVLEPGRWLVAPAAVLVARVLWVKRQGARRVVVIGAGMNDLLRPALYAARHRIECVAPRPGPPEPAMVVGPVCESADVFDAEALLPPLLPGDLLVLRDVGAYGSAMASNYNGRGRLPEVAVEGGALRAVRAPESPQDLARGACDREL